MIQVYMTNTATGRPESIDYSTLNCHADLNNKWISLINPTDKEIESICALTGVQEDIVKAPLDEEERSRIEHEDGYSLILFDIPYIEEEEGGYYSYTTLPFGFVMGDNFVLTVSIKEPAAIADFVNGRVKTFLTQKRTRFLFQALYNTSIKYLAYLKQIDKASGRIQNELHKSTRNKELIQLLDLENSLVYFSTSLKGNDIVISKLIATKQIKKYEEDDELLEDVAIENKQAIEMTNIYRDILSGTMDAYASVISNNLNIVMKVLTSVTLLISIPTLIASFFGMNTGVPGQGSIIAFWVVVGVSVVISAVVGFILKKKKLL